jgi:hypothetical protein
MDDVLGAQFAQAPGPILARGAGDDRQLGRQVAGGRDDQRIGIFIGTSHNDCPGML